MSRRLAIVLLFAPAAAAADDTAAPGQDSATTATAETGNPSAPADMNDQAISATLGVAFGGRTTPGGLAVAGHYFYQLSDHDWFDGSAQFVFGSGGAECFRDRMNDTICDHGLADGYAGGVGAGVRRFLPALASGDFWPFARAGLAAAVVRFPDDETTGITLDAQLGAGMRVAVSEAIAITAQFDFVLGLGRFSNGVGGEPQLGVMVTAGAEFRL
ncbi:MAG TPA: hypothetical protein VFV99_13445 [Kofleriaceae bacterium]|nr:hypothetical protein [Kofleriaceae bacterium]